MIERTVGDHDLQHLRRIDATPGVSDPGTHHCLSGHI
jgi:hypothetical protein